LTHHLTPHLLDATSSARELVEPLASSGLE
jgi:hypothetical protein